MNETISPESTLMITPSEVVEHLYCPRFTYFMNCLNIPQHEEKRYKVMRGRQLHEDRGAQNREYIRKKLKCVNKEIDVYLASPGIHVRGVVDEILYLGDGSMAPLDYKFAEYKDYLFDTHKVQLTLYAMLIKEIYNKPVIKGYLCYVRSNSKIREVIFSEEHFENALKTLNEIFSVMEKGYFPKRTSSKAKCIDCCYKNICV